MGDMVTQGECQQTRGEILKALKDLNDRLYRDNGHLSIQTRLDRQEQVLKTFTKAIGTMGAVLGTTIVGLLWKLIVGAASQ